MDIIHNIYNLFKQNYKSIDKIIFISNESLIKIIYDTPPKIIKLESLTPYYNIIPFIQHSKNIHKNKFELDKYIFEINPLTNNKSPLTINNVKYNIVLNEFINHTDEINIENDVINNILNNPLLVLEIIYLLCMNIKINDDLKQVLFCNIDNIENKYKNIPVYTIVENIYKIENTQMFKKLLINEYSWIFKMIMHVNYDVQIFNDIEFMSPIDIFLVMLVQYNKYDHKKENIKLLKKLKGIKYLNDVKINLNLFNKTLDEYHFSKLDTVRFKQIYYIFEILNSPVIESLKIGFLYKNYYLFDYKNIEFCVNYHNNINNTNIQLDILNNSLPFINKQSENLPKYKKNEVIDIQDFQNCYILFYQYIYDNKISCINKYSKIFKKTIKIYIKYKNDMIKKNIFEVYDLSDESNEDSIKIFNDIIL